MEDEQDNLNPEEPEPDPLAPYYDLASGAVLVLRGEQVGRIGYYDSDDLDDNDVPCACITFGEYLISRGLHMVPHGWFRYATTEDLLVRRDEIQNLLVFGRRKRIGRDRRLSLFEELNYVEAQLYHRLMLAKFGRAEGGVRVFVSHSSRDEAFAEVLATDLRNLGFDVWLDKWHIKVGESIPSRISDGIQGASALIVVLSEEAVASKWVEREWQAKYWDELESGDVAVLAVLHKPCTVPTLLKSKKYANFTSSYHDGLEELVAGLGAIARRAG